MGHPPLQIQQSILAGTKRVVDLASFVRIDLGALYGLAKQYPTEPAQAPAWDTDRHFSDGTADTAQWVFVLDSLNFSFWPDPGEPRWGVEWNGALQSGYWALACSLKRAMQNGVPITDAKFLEAMTEEQLSAILAGAGRAPLLGKRAEVLREVGRVLTNGFGGTIVNLLNAANHSAQQVVHLLSSNFPSFCDTAVYRGEAVWFLKRAQIFVSDLWGTFGGIGFGHFTDLESLTAFADYRLPQLLRQHGILHYADELAERVDNNIEIPAGSDEEIEIRAATIQAVEGMRQSLERDGRGVPSYMLDWWLWGSPHPQHSRPHHRTRTIAY
jgi:hypothetical protein